MLFPSLEIAGIRTLSDVPQWVLWRFEKRGGKLTKIPRDPKQARNASSTNPKTWGTFTEAYEGHSRYECDGVGFVFTADDDFIGVDLDKCRNIDDGIIDTWAQKIVARLDSYTEISPSRTGVHIICRGRLEQKRRRRGQVECYTSKRYFTVTGEVVGKESDIAVIAEPLDWVFDVGPSTRHEEKPASSQSLVPVFSNPEHTKLELHLNPHALADADIMQERFDVLKTNTEIVEGIWERTAAIGRDWSPSEWDLSLANYFVSAGWPDIEIMRGLIAHRRKHGDDLKLDREHPSDYYVRTILTARQGRERDEAQEMISPAAMETIPETIKKEHVLAALTSIYDVGIEAIIRIPANPNRYEIVTNRGTVGGDIDLILSQNTLRRAMADIIGLIIAKTKSARHDERSQAMLDIAEIGSVGIEATEKGQIQVWLQLYLASFDNAIEPEFAAEVIKGGGLPFYKDSHLWIPGSKFQIWLTRNLQVRVTTTKFGILMRSAGCKPTALNIDIDGKRTSFSAWKIPHEVMR